MKKILSLTLVLSFLFLGAFSVFEPEVSSAFDDNLAVSLAVISDITTGCSDVTMSELGAGADVSVGSSTCSIEHSDVNGATFSIKSLGTYPDVLALDASNGFTDIATDTPAIWSSPSAGNTAFGVSVANTESSPGSEINATTWGTGGAAGEECGLTSVPGSLKYVGLSNSASLAMVDSTGTTAGYGDGAFDFKICFAAEKENTVVMQDGNYTASLQVTATTK